MKDPTLVCSMNELSLKHIFSKNILF